MLRMCFVSDLIMSVRLRVSFRDNETIIGMNKRVSCLRC